MKDIIVVTGASSGIGKEFVLQIAKRVPVDEIWVIARREERLFALKDLIDTPVVPLSIDLSDLVQIQKYAERLQQEKPNIRILANCSGFGKFDHYENIPSEVHQNMVDLNCKAVMAMIDASLPYMREGAHIMNIASDAAFQPLPYINVYASTKAFQLSYSRALNRELNYRGIHVLAVCPYWTKTEFFDRATRKDTKPVIINYGVMYEAEKVVKKAIYDLLCTKKDMSVYGMTNCLQWFGSKLVPHKIVMNIWMNRQKFDGTRKIR